MIKPYFFRSTLFNLCYYLLIAISCIILLPTLLLPRKVFLTVVHYFVHTTALLERWILGLTYEIRGTENLPKDGAYIVAAKHQSAFETTKLHILFKDPAIVLKKELLSIPLWGKYLAKSDVIAIDRSTPKIAIESMQSEAKRVAAQNREIIVFPQGTRVAPETSANDRPYKVGIVRIQEATELPIIPMALNSGYYYPRNAWIKKPGTVVFEFLPPIQHTPGKIPDDTLKPLQMNTEEASSKLLQEAQEKHYTSNKPNLIFKIALIIMICVIAWSIYWFSAARITENAIQQALHDLKQNPHFTSTKISEPIMSGFPGKIRVDIEEISAQTQRGQITISTIKAASWPFPAWPITIEANTIDVLKHGWSSPLNFDSFAAAVTQDKAQTIIHDAKLFHKQSVAELSGTISQNPDYPEFMLELTWSEHELFLKTLKDKNIINNKELFVASFAMQALKQDDTIKAELLTDENKVYLGPILVFQFPKTNAAALLENGKPSAYATTRKKPDNPKK